jgi:hypothetical protein
MKSRLAAAVIGPAGALVVGAGVVYATIPDLSGVIHGCYAKVCSTARRALVGLATLLLSALCVAAVGPATAQAAVGPVQVLLRDPGPSGCPTGSYVATNPGPVFGSPFFVLKDPGPGSCAPGIDLFRNPGPPGAPQGIAVALPLTATDCTQGTALFDTELLLLGAALPGPGVGTISSSGPSASSCASGDAALSDLQVAIANVPVAPGPSGLDRGGPVPLLPAVQNPGGNLLVSPGNSSAPALAGMYGDDLTGTPVIVAFQVGDPDQPILVSSAVPSVPGVTVLKNPGPGSTPTLDATVCIQIGAIWQQSGTCEISGAAMASSSFTIPPATALLVDPGATLTVAGGGMLNLGSGGALDDGGVRTLKGTATNNGSVTIAPNGITTIQQSGSLVNGGMLTNNGTLTNDGTFINNGFIDQGVFADNGICVNC